VTGFGVLGHLLEMVRSSDNVEVELDLEALPVLDGAEETVAQGITSTLQPGNLRLRRAVRDPGPIARSSRYALLFDPQTAGGLLATVPAERADDCVTELRRRRDDRAAVIGAVRTRRDDDHPVTIRAGTRTRPATVAG
jgi:selenide,water dikinase